MKPGIYDMPADAYHADPCPEPSLSRSLIVTMLNQTLGHARDEHPRLGNLKRESQRWEWNRGTGIHALALEGDEERVVVTDEHKAFQTKAAKAWRDETLAAGKIPALRRQYDDIRAAVSAIRHQTAQMAPPAFTLGAPEQTLVWQEVNGVWCRARLDWLREDLTLVDDLKTTDLSAKPESYGRYIWRSGLDIQAAWYLRAVRSVFPGSDPRFRFVVAEMYGGNRCSSVTLDAAGLATATAKIEYAIERWGDALETGDFPAYPREMVEVETPAYEIARWELVEAEGW